MPRTESDGAAVALLLISGASTLIAEAASLLQRGRWEQALQTYERAFRNSFDSGGTTAHTLESVRRIGYAYFIAGDSEIALEYLELATHLATLHGDYSGLARALNGIATVHHSSGRTDQADNFYVEALAAAAASHDSIALGDIHQNRGALACVRGDRHSALTYFRASLSQYAAANHQLGKAQALHNIGLLHVELGDHDTATTHIRSALEIFAAMGDWRSHAAALLSQAEVSIAGADFQHAQRSLSYAFNYACDVDDPRLRAEALKYAGILDLSRGNPVIAARQLRNAVTLARAYQFPQTEAEALRELALALRQLDRNADALHALTAAHKVFSSIQADRQQEEISGHLRRLEQDFLDIVQHWISSIEENDPYTRGHCQRVASYACKLATQAGVPDGELAWFRMGALLHDVGKMSISGAILRKPEPLSDAERNVIQQHPLVGEQLMSAAAFPWNIREMIRSHHERWDGNGYPDGLTGASIPLNARILRFADVFDALTTERPYRAALPPPAALEVMREDSGGFDPSLFRHFEEVFADLAGMVAGAERSSTTYVSASESRPIC